MTELETPFHEGELAIQEKLGVRELVHSYAPKFVRSFLPEQHRDLLETLPFIVVGSVNSNQQPSASILFGSQGFIQSPDETTMQVEATLTSGDPLRDNLRMGSPLGFLAIDFETRRRNRLTGKITRTDQNGFAIKVDQSFGNCPQYIQSRTSSAITDKEGTSNAGEITTPLSHSELTKRLSSADTFFVASSYFKDQGDRKHGVDVSHRGGKAGFMKLAGNILKFPDFSGNHHYNTFGNIVLNPKVGIVVPDFDTGDMLYIEGTADIIWSGPEVDAFEGAERLVTVQITKSTLVERAMPMTWKFNDYSPSLEATGDWNNGNASANDDEQWRSLRVDRIERESSTINSFYLTATDGLPLEGYKAGQHLPIHHPSAPKTIRTYTLSKAPCGSQYRLSIKREANGKFSRFMHDELRVGTTVSAMAPRGVFHLPDAPSKPLVLVSAGVGITPMIAMLEAAVNTSGCANGKKAAHPIVFIRAARNGDEHAFKNHPILSNPVDFGVTLLLAYSQPTPQDIIDKKFQIRGRITAQTIAELIPTKDIHAFLCGPDQFMADMRAHLNNAGVNDTGIEQETFGGSAVARDPMPDVEIPVQLKSSGKQLTWNPSKSTLLETIEDAGVDAPFACRIGNCGTCVTKVLKGKMGHPETAQYKPAEDEALICCAVPDHNPDKREDLIALDI